MKCANHAMFWKAWDISTAFFSILHVFWQNSMVSTVESTSWKPLEKLFRRLKISKCPYMPRPSRTCAFGASSKAAYYSLSTCFLKTFWQPWMWKKINIALLLFAFSVTLEKLNRNPQACPPRPHPKFSFTHSSLAPPLENLLRGPCL